MIHNDSQGNAYERTGGFGGYPNFDSATGGSGATITNTVVTVGIVSMALTTTGARDEKFLHNQYTSRENKKSIGKVIDASITNQSQTNYWTADLINHQIVGGVPLTVQEAVVHVAMGNSIMCRNHAAARHIIYLNGYINAVGPEQHGDGFYHYHPTRNHTGHPSIHSWYFS